MSRSQRDKGKRGETAARALLESRDFDVDDLTDGQSCADFVAIDTDGIAWSVEVKNQVSIHPTRFRTQAKTNAGRKRWMVLAHIDGTSSWLVLRQAQKPDVWHEAL